MRGAWARFAKNPAGGPGWNRVGTGVNGSVLVGASNQQAGGIYLGSEGEKLDGPWNLGVLGNRGVVLGSGVTVIDEQEVDFRCGVYDQIYDYVNSLRLE